MTCACLLMNSLTDTCRLFSFSLVIALSVSRVLRSNQLLYAIEYNVGFLFAAMASVSHELSEACKAKASELGNIKESIKSLQGEKAKLQSKQKAEGVTAYHFNVATFVFALSGWKLETALSYVSLRCLSISERQVNACRDNLIAWRATLTTAKEDDCFKGGGKKARSSQLNSARKFIAEHRLHTWVESENMDKGIAPPSRLIIEKKRDLEQLQDTELDCLPPPLNNKGKKWLKRWRQRWRIAIGTIGKQRLIEPHVMQEKESICSRPPLVNPPYLEIINLAPTFQTPFGKGVLLAAPNLGPPIII